MSRDERLEKVSFALARVVRRAVTVYPRKDWDEQLRPGGEATVLPEPPGPFLGIQHAPGFEIAVASGAPAAPDAGFHFVRRDGAIYKRYSHDVIEDLVADDRWAEVLRVAEETEDEELREVVRAHVFMFTRDKDDHPLDDHYSTTVSEDIAAAKPREDLPG